MHVPRPRDLARKLAILAVLVGAFSTGAVPIAAASGPDQAGNGSSAVDAHKPAGAGDGRKYK